MKLVIEITVKAQSDSGNDIELIANGFYLAGGAGYIDSAWTYYYKKTIRIEF